MHGAINIAFFKRTQDSLARYIGNIIVIIHLSTIVTAIFVYLLYPYLFTNVQMSRPWVIISVLLAFANFFTATNLLLWTLEEKAIHHSFFQIIQTAATATLTIILVVGVGLQWEGQVLAVTFTTIIFSAISFTIIFKKKYVDFSPSTTDTKQALKFGLPLIPHSLANWIKSSADRLILIGLVGATATGIYSAAYQIGLVVSIIVASFNKAWTPYIYRTLSSSPTYEKKRLLVRKIYLYFLSVLILAIAFPIIIKPLISIFIGEQYTEATDYIGYFSLSFAFNGMYLSVVTFIFFTEKTALLTYISTTTSLIHIVILYYLINANGAIGAAQAGVITYLLTFIATWIASARIYEMPWSLCQPRAPDRKNQ
jgi:O-antigen/teichoic acid export membrane protein